MPKNGDRSYEFGYRYGWLVLIVIALLIFVGLKVLSDHSPGPTAAEQNPIQCSTGDSLSCYYVNSNRPVNGAQSVNFDGQTVPVVGIEPTYCVQSLDNCPYEGYAGEYVVSDVRNGPKQPSRLEAEWSPTPPAGATGATGGTGAAPTGPTGVSGGTP